MSFTLQTIDRLWAQIREIVHSSRSPSEIGTVLEKLAKYCPIGNVEQKADVIQGLIQILIQDRSRTQGSSIVEWISAIESLSILIRNIRCDSRPVTYSYASRIFLAWHDVDVVLRHQNNDLRIAFDHLVFLTCIKCIFESSLEVVYYIVPAHQLTPTKKGYTGWTTPYAQISKYDEEEDDAVSGSKALRNDALDIKKMFHCIFMIHMFATTDVVTSWISLCREYQSQEQIVLAQICLLLNIIDSAADLVSHPNFVGRSDFLFHSCTTKLYQNNYFDALESIIEIIRNSEEEFCRAAVQPADGISDYFLGGTFEFVSGRSVMFEYVRLIMACISAVNFPITARIALCQYAWPTMQFEFKKLLADHVADNCLFEFEQFREQILHVEIVDAFLALHRAGKLHMKLGVPQMKQSGRLLRGATRNSSITTEISLEDHIVNYGNQFASIGPVLFNLVTNEIYSFCCANRNR